MRLVEDDWLTVGQIAEKFQISQSWLAEQRHRVRTALDEGKPRPVDSPPFIELGRAVRYPASGVEEFIQQNLK